MKYINKSIGRVIVTQEQTISKDQIQGINVKKVTWYIEEGKTNQLLVRKSGDILKDDSV